MKTLNIYQIAFSTLGILASACIVTAEPGTDAPSPAELTATRCLICHGNPEAGNSRLAPPFMMMKMHYQSLDKKAFIKAVSSWVKKPDPKKSRMPGAINRFGLMPALPYPDAEIAAIAKYLYETQFSMPGRGGMSCGSGATTAPKAVNGCGTGCDSCKSAAPTATTPCETGNGKAAVSASEPSENRTSPQP